MWHRKVWWTGWTWRGSDSSPWRRKYYFPPTPVQCKQPVSCSVTIQCEGTVKNDLLSAVATAFMLAQRYSRCTRRVPAPFSPVSSADILQCYNTA
jgi:hypothetical protein